MQQLMEQIEARPEPVEQEKVEVTDNKSVTSEGEEELEEVSSQPRHEK